MKSCFLATLLWLVVPALLRAESPPAQPLLEITSGLPGNQVRLSWSATVGQSYRIERSTALASGAAGSWTQLALVEAAGAECVWLDPEPTSQKAFYRVTIPQADVFSISPPLLSPSGGELLVRGQRIPAGSFLVLEIDGAPPSQLSVPLEDLGGGVWRASVAHPFVPGASVISALIVDGNGSTLVTLNLPLTVTPTGLALDSPPSLPPASPDPQAQSNPIPGIGIVLKKNGIGSTGGRSLAGGPNQDCDDGDPFSPLGMAIKEKGLPGDKKPRPWGPTNPKPQRTAYGPEECDDGNCDPGDGSFLSIALSHFLSKKGYDYYKAQSDMNSAGMQHNPYFVSGGISGNMPSTSAREGIQHAVKHPDLMKREMGPAAITPAPSGLPGEVSFQTCDLSLACPAGPPLAWVRTYRSMKPLNSGHGTGWDFSYNIWIETLPSSAGTSASRVVIHDGGGRADIFLRQADATYRCEGMFREGRFTGDTFTLTFADKGTWTFNPLDRSPSSGKIAAITDRNGLALTCAYNPTTGLLASVSDSFSPPHSLNVTWDGTGFITRVADSSGRSVQFTPYGAANPDGNEGDLKSASSPQIGGTISVVGATIYTYSTGNSDPNLNHNLLSITDGAGRLLEAFAYSAQSDPLQLDYDTLVSHNRYKTGHVTLNRRELLPPGSSPVGGYTIFEVDEIGRLIETVCDRLHRVVSLREYTGFCVPGIPVTSTDNRPTGPLRANDPPYFETTCDYNADSLCKRITHPDGSQELVTYNRDFQPGCPVRERANPRVITLRSASGEERVVTCTYQPGFGNPESARPGNPIGGLCVKGGRNPGGLGLARPGNPIGGLCVKGGQHRADNLAKVRKGGMIKGNISISTASRQAAATVFRKEEGGRHTPFQNRSSIAGITGGAVAGIVVAACAVGEDEDCNGMADDSERKIGQKQKAWLCSNFRLSMVSAHGQVSSWSYDEHGNCTSALSPLPGKGVLYQYNTRGQCTGTTVLNGPDASFHDECTYDAATGLPSSLVCDSTGLHLTTSVAHDSLGRVTSVTDPRGNDWLYTYNPLDQCVQVQSPAMPQRISMNFTIDAGGRIARCDLDHLAPDGTANATNPTYSTFYVYDDRARLVQVADEERPVNPAPGALTPNPQELGSYAICNLTYDDAGQIVRVSTPAACRAQATDLACDFTYDERGLLHHCIDGGTGNPNAVTTECDYDLLGDCVRSATLASDGVSSPQMLFTYDGFHRLASATDPMDNLTIFEYGNDGSVTTSVYGQVNDVPGAKGNVLLAKHNAKMSDLQSNPMYAGRASNGFDSKSSGLLVERAAFFTVETLNDTFTVERFSPGDSATHPTEVTVVDRSPAGLVQAVTCNGDLLLSCEYDSAGRLIRCQDGTCAAVRTLDACGNVTSVTRTDISGVVGVPNKTFTVAQTIDPLGRNTQSTDGTGNTASFAFDSLDRCVTVTEPGGLIVHATYDSDSPTGPFSIQISADVNGDGTAKVLSSTLVRCGECRSVTNSNGNSAVFSNDALGRVVRCDHPDTTHEEWSYDSLGRNDVWICQDLSLRTTTFDLNGRPTSCAWSNTAAGVPPVPDTTYLHDGLGRCVSAGQDSSIVSFTFDSCGNPTSETQNGLTVSRTFNHRGRTSITYPDGRQFVESRDATGLLLALYAVSGGKPLTPPVVTLDHLGHRVCRSTHGNGVVTNYSYRGDGDAPLAGANDASFDDCVRITVSNAAATLLSDTILSRDSNQRDIRERTAFAAGTGAPGRSKSFTLDRLGRVTDCITNRRSVANGEIIVESHVTYTLDLEGRRLTATGGDNPGTYTQISKLPPGDQQMSQYTSWPRGPLVWDDNGNLALMTTATGSLTFVHDADGRLVAVNDTATGSPITSYDYDPLGRVMIHKIHHGGGLQSIASRFVYDGSVCIQELSDDGSGVLSPDMTLVCANGLKQCISTRNGTIYYPHGGLENALIRPGHHKPGTCSSITLITNATGEAVERFDCDDACKPIFLDAKGTPVANTSSSIGLRWMAPESSWEPEIGTFHGTDGTYSPDLGQLVSRRRPGSHWKGG